MKIALRLAERGRGWTGPNPMVGAVAVKNGQILSTGYHRRYGSAHAEAVALQGIRPEGITLYVTLEPCVHFGNTPPCTDLILEKKVKRLVVATCDPNPRVYRRGIRRLRAAGLQVDVGILGKEVRELNRHYFTYHREGRPHVTLKAGITIDGKLTDKEGESQWITSPRMRRLSHLLRGEFDAVMVGKNTILRDNPHLNIRQGKWRSKSLQVVVLDSRNNLDPGLNIFRSPVLNNLLVFSSSRCPDREKKCDRHFFVEEKNGRLELKKILKILHEHRVVSILVEGGGRLIGAFLEAKLAHEMMLFCSGTLLGGKDSVELFAAGTRLTRPVRLMNRRIYDFQTGYLVKGAL